MEANLGPGMWKPAAPRAQHLRLSRQLGPERHNNPSTIGSLITPGILLSVLNWDDTVDVRADRYGDWLVWAR